MDDLETREVYQRILVAGGGEVETCTLRQAIKAGAEGDRLRLTHVFADPWIQEPGDPRYRKFQQWLSQEREAVRGTWKIFYRFLPEKLTIFNRAIEEADYEISLKKIKKEALARARLRRQTKVKEEAEAKAELIILKEKIVKRNTSERSYLDRSRGEKPEIHRPKLEQKRRAEWDGDISSQESSQGRKRAKNSSWYLESAQMSYVQNLAANIKRNVEAGNCQDYSAFNKKYGIKQEPRRSSRPPVPDVKFKASNPVITLDDSDSEEIQEVPKLSVKKHENDMSAQLVKQPKGTLPPEIVLESEEEGEEEPLLIPTLGECTPTEDDIVELSVEESDIDQSQDSIALQGIKEDITEDEVDGEVTGQSEEKEEGEHVVMDTDVGVQKTLEKSSVDIEEVVGDIDIGVEVKKQKSPEQSSMEVEGGIADGEMKEDKNLICEPDSLIIADLNRTLAARQKQTYEHLLTANIIPPILQESKDQKPRTKSSTHLSDEVREEFIELSQLKIVNERPRRGRRRAEKDDSEEGLPDNDQTRNQDKLGVLWIFERYLPEVQVSPLVWNCIFKEFLSAGNCPAVLERTENLILRYIRLKLSPHRDLITTNILNGLREVIARSGFRGFDKTSARDSSEVWRAFKTILDNCLSAGPNPADETLLSILIEICQQDLVLWWNSDRSEIQGSRPFVFFLFGGKDFYSNSANYLPKIYERFLSANTDLLGKIRILVAVVAHLTAYLDSSEEKEEFVTRGSKLRLAKGLAGVLAGLREETELHIELELLRPSWLSYLVSRELRSEGSGKSCNSLTDILDMFDKLTVEDRRGMVARRVMLHKYMAFTNTSLLFRANWFFSTQPEGDFRVFPEFRKLIRDEEERKEEMETVLLRGFIKLTVTKQVEDMKTVAKYSNGSLETGVQPDTSCRALLFNMTDPAWNPVQHSRNEKKEK